MKTAQLIFLVFFQITFSNCEERFFCSWISSLFPPKCPNGEEYMKNYCEPTCSTVLNEPCLDCKNKKDGCFCKKGKIRSDNGICIPIEECSKLVCPEPNTKLYLSIQKTKVCVKEKIETVCLPRCMSKCDCIDGYVHDGNINGKCISEIECTKKCEKQNEIYQEGGCNSSCSTALEDYLCFYCPPSPPGCYCKYGTIRNSDGDCIPYAECPKPTCTEPFTELVCGSYFESCYNGTIDTIIYFLPVYHCYCTHGSIPLHDSDGNTIKCIPRDECSSYTN